MTGKEMDGLFDLLKIYYPHSPKPHDKLVKRAWFLILEPYEFQDVKSALVRFARQNPKFFPDPQEIATLCPELPEENCRRNEREDAFARDYHRFMGPLWEKLDAARSRGLSREECIAALGIFGDKNA